MNLPAENFMNKKRDIIILFFCGISLIALVSFLIFLQNDENMRYKNNLGNLSSIENNDKGDIGLTDEEFNEFFEEEESTSIKIIDPEYVLKAFLETNNIPSSTKNLIIGTEMKNVLSEHNINNVTSAEVDYDNTSLDKQNNLLYIRFTMNEANNIHIEYVINGTDDTMYYRYIDDIKINTTDENAVTVNEN